MRIGQSSVIHLVSQIATSVLGFLVTLFVAQTLGNQGDDVLGVYFVVVAVIIWLRVIAGLGVQSAVKKRLSEGVDQGRYLTAGILLQGAAFLLIAGVLLVAEPFVIGYLRNVSVVTILILLLATLGFRFVTSVLDGLHLVHVSSLLSPVDRFVRSLVQIGLVFLGFALTGLLVGYGVAAVLAALAGVYFVRLNPAIPRRTELTDLVSYARFSWLSSMSGRAYNSMDTLVLGLFVAEGLIGVYNVSWNLASVLAIFGTSISRATFPEISDLSSDDRHQEAAGLVTDSLRFAGIFLIPGLVGTAILQEQVLRVYGSEFTKGGTVLVILVAAQLSWVYGRQFINALNAVDRPDLAFRVDGVFLVANLVLNLGLVALFGWHGAAVATAISTGLALVLAYRAADAVLGMTIPLGDIAHQVLAAIVMGVAIIVGDILLPGTLAISISLVFGGAVVYVAVLLGISATLRSTIRANVPHL